MFKMVRNILIAFLIFAGLIIVSIVLADFNETLVVIWIGLLAFGSILGVTIYSIANEKDKSLPLLKRLRDAIPEATKKFFLAVGILVGAAVVVTIWDEPSTTSKQIEFTDQPSLVAPSRQVESAATSRPAIPVHYDSSYKYNYRTGYSGSYDYNYDVEGYSDSGDYFYGNVDTQDKYGEGYVYDEYGNEIYVETEWVDYGVMEATDEYGNSYEFEVY